MRDYLVFPDLGSALARSHTETLSRGCDPAGETQYWWAQIAHPTSGQWALVILDDDVAGLTSMEQAALVPDMTMQSGGWFS